jgi:uncharacterized tellurite resistance protein B-like protein
MSELKLSLSVLKEYLIIKDEELDELSKELNDWVNENVSDEDVSVKEWLSKFNEFWNEMSDDYGDSGEIEEILNDVYKLSESEVDEVMMVYWDCDSMEEYIEDYK